jgi:alcohol dehydrogenase YqhD (iron-dependent ADH family)
MENFEFYNPVRVIFGPGEVSKTGVEAKALGKTALLVTYEEYDFFEDLLKNIQSQMEAEGMKVVPFYKITANPTIGQVRDGVALSRAEDVDVIVGVGGGSAMDAAKAIAAGVLYDGDPWMMVYSRHDNIVTVPPEDALPILLVPTLPATSSEMNSGAVITNEEIKEKSYIWHPCLYAKTAILDPELTTSLPPYQTGCGAADAISHVMEVYFNGADDTPLHDYLMEGLILTLMEYAPKALENPDDVVVRGHLQWTSAVAWNGWTLTGTATSSPMHWPAHTISARHNITHGATLAIIMPAWLKYFRSHRPDRYIRFADRIMGMDVSGRDADEVALEAIDKFEAFLKSIGVQTRLSEVGIGADDIDAMVEDTFRVYAGEDGKLGARPPATREDVKKIYEMAL